MFRVRCPVEVFFKMWFEVPEEYVKVALYNNFGIVSIFSSNDLFTVYLN